MIVPQSRLLGWVGLVGVPAAAAITTTYAPARAVGWLVLGALAAAAVLDAVLAAGMSDGLRAELPAVTRLAKDRLGQIRLRLVNPSRQRRVVRVGLAWPAELGVAAPELLTELPAGAEHAELVWPCQPVRRGRQLLDRCYFERASRLGFWAVRTAVPVQGEIRVYPNLARERRSLAGIFLHRTSLGAHAQRQVGKGRDFEKLREYVAGDSFEDIHWKATARRGRPITKVYQIERTQEVYVLVDASRLSGRRVARETPRPGMGTRDARPTQEDTRDADPTEETTLERFLTAALVLGLVAEQQGDLFGVVTFSDRVHRFLRARNGKAHYGACRDALYTLEPRLVNPDFNELCTQLRLQLRRRALLVFLTSLDDPVLAETFLRNIELIRRQHLVLVNVLPPGELAPLFAGAPVTSTADIYRRLGGHLQWQQLRELERSLHHRGVQLRSSANENLAVELVADYLRVKQRQLL